MVPTACLAGVGREVILYGLYNMKHLETTVVNWHFINEITIQSLQKTLVFINLQKNFVNSGRLILKSDCSAKIITQVLCVILKELKNKPKTTGKKTFPYNFLDCFMYSTYNKNTEAKTECLKNKNQNIPNKLINQNSFVERHVPELWLIIVQISCAAKGNMMGVVVANKVKGLY